MTLLTALFNAAAILTTSIFIAVGYNVLVTQRSPAPSQNPILMWMQRIRTSPVLSVSSPRHQTFFILTEATMPSTDTGVGGIDSEKESKTDSSDMKAQQHDHHSEDKWQ